MSERTVDLDVEYKLIGDMHNPVPTLRMIIQHSNEELVTKFPAYGNSYTNIADWSLTKWFRRIDNEVWEYEHAMTSVERKRKLANLFNLIWMAYYFEAYSND